jgi:hypothetical protein
MCALRASGAAAVPARALLESIDTSTLAGLLDRALIGVMTYAFACIGAVVATAYLEAGGTLQNAQMMAAHESPRTTKL